MMPQKENPRQARVFIKHFTDGPKSFTLCQCNINTNLIVPHPSYLRKPPLVGAFCRVLHQPDALRVFGLVVPDHQKATDSKRVDNGPTPDCHDQHVNARERTSTSLYRMLGKWGNYETT